MKFERPSKIQASTLPMILRKAGDGFYRDLIAQAHNGSGKTTCFVLAMLSRCGGAVQRAGGCDCGHGHGNGARTDLRCTPHAAVLRGQTPLALHR
jgi:ATP-dependent helicase YprA (DUF1998 family)